MFKRVAGLVGCAMLFGCGGVDSENEEIVANLIQAGFPANDIQIVDDNVYVGGDAHVTLEASREMIQPSNSTLEQYRTNNLVNISQRRKICVNPTSTFNSYSQLSAGLDLALVNYNSLGLMLTFVRGPGATGCYANITAQAIAGTGGSAGYPAGGYPYGTISIGTGLQSYNADVNEHVITHEIGHTIGFRHSDYYDRSISCGGSYSPESEGPAGAILILGTPSTATLGGSIMNACFPPTTNGEWTSTDITALNYLY